jgi:curved DNA-binding protein
MSATEADQRRRAPRRKILGTSVLRIELKDGMGNSRNITADLADWSETGLSVTLVAPIKVGTIIQVRGKLGDERVEISRRASILWCTEDDNGGYRIGLEFLDREAGSGSSGQHSRQSDYKLHSVASDFQDLDCYEIMQLSPNADNETVHRVYRLLAQRFHPDNTESGNAELFVQLTAAFQVLSDPEKRAAYDARHSAEKTLRWKIFDQAVVATGPDVEKRKRRGILGLLYAATVKDPERATMTVHAFEDMLGCPREHLEAALWYLRGKGHVLRTDGGRYSLTVQGFEEAEEHCVTAPKNAGELTEATGKT